MKVIRWKGLYFQHFLLHAAQRVSTDRRLRRLEASPRYAPLLLTNS